jgi:hypothetical protein
MTTPRSSPTCMPTTRRGSLPRRGDSRFSQGAGGALYHVDGGYRPR